MTGTGDHADSISSPAMSYDDLDRLMSRMTGDAKHSDAATSTLDVLWTLYDRVLGIDPSDPTESTRDRLFLSKGHGPVAYYAVLAAKGFIDPNLLDTFGSFDSVLGHHPDRLLIPGVEISSGSLGQGLALGVGSALGLRLAGIDSRVFVVLGDGELDEGANHEAIALAGRFNIAALTAIVIDNGSATHGWPGGIDRRFAIEGWETATVDGRDHDEIFGAVTRQHLTTPMAVVAVVGRNNG